MKMYYYDYYYQFYIKSYCNYNHKCFNQIVHLCKLAHQIWRCAIPLFSYETSHICVLVTALIKLNEWFIDKDRDLLPPTGGYFF